MQIIKEIYKDQLPLYPIEEFCPKENALYIDIETTGLSKEKTSLYLIGCGYYKENDFVTKLFFADDPTEELEILNKYIEFSKSFTHLFHFNGSKFDIPYLTYKAEKYNLGNIFENLEQVDVYQLSKPLRYLLFPMSMRQKCIEEFLNIKRNDMYNGGELISVYHSYVKTQNKEDFEKLITHNLEDVLGMHKIMPILHFLKLKDTKLSYHGYEIKTYKDYNGNEQKEILFEYSFDEYLPLPFSSKTETMYLKVNNVEKKAIFRLPIYDDTKKLFFENYRDYYYLPSEDTCIHRSVAMGLDKKSYIKASKDTCYIKKTCNFIKEPGKIFTPVFKDSYKDKALYFAFPESFNLEKVDEFGRALLDVYFCKKPRK